MNLKEALSVLEAASVEVSLGFNNYADTAPEETNEEPEDSFAVSARYLKISSKVASRHYYVSFHTDRFCCGHTEVGEWRNFISDNSGISDAFVTIITRIPFVKSYLTTTLNADYQQDWVPILKNNGWKVIDEFTNRAHRSKVLVLSALSTSNDYDDFDKYNPLVKRVYHKTTYDYSN